jgi:hypothetical protein
MSGTVKIRGCYAHNGNLVLLSDGELGVYLHQRRCEDLHGTGDKVEPGDYPVQSIRTDDRPKMVITSG